MSGACVIWYHTLCFTDGCAYVTYTDDDSVTKVLDACVRVNGRRDVLTVKKSNGRLVKVKLHHLHVRHEQWLLRYVRRWRHLWLSYPIDLVCIVTCYSKLLLLMLRWKWSLGYWKTTDSAPRPDTSTSPAPCLLAVFPATTRLSSWRLLYKIRLVLLRWSSFTQIAVSTQQVRKYVR